MIVGRPTRKGIQPPLPRPRRLRWSPDATYLYPLATVVLILLAWEAAARLGYVPRYLLPAPTGIVGRGSQLAGFLLRESLVTSEEVLLGFGLSVMLGVPLAIGLVAWPSFQRAVYPLLVGTQVVPKLAIAPLLLVWFGFGMTSKVLVAFLVAFFPIVIDSVIGLRSVETAKLYVARAAGASELQLFWLVRLPNALPFIFGGMKVSITLAVVGALVGEFVAAESGLGRVLLSANGNMDTELLFAAIFALVIIGVALFLVLEALERLMLPWHVSQRAERRSDKTL